METTKKYKVLQPIALSGRKEIGEVVELTDAEAATFSSGMIELVADEADAPAAPEKPAEENPPAADDVTPGADAPAAPAPEVPADGAPAGE